MTRLYLWTVCAVALMGVAAEYVGVRVPAQDGMATNYTLTVSNASSEGGTLTLGSNSWYIATDEVLWLTNYITNSMDSSLHSTNDGYWFKIKRTDWFDNPPSNTVMESTHKPTLSHSNNVWIIRFQL